MARGSLSNDTLVRGGLLLGGLLLVNKVFGWFAPDSPGGSVTPALGDTRQATLDTVTANALADRIEVAVWGSGAVEAWTEDEEEFAACLMVCQVTNDVRLLMNAYGNRGTHFDKLNLVETVAAYLDDDYRAAVNADYLAKRITIAL